MAASSGRAVKPWACVLSAALALVISGTALAATADDGSGGDPYAWRKTGSLREVRPRSVRRFFAVALGSGVGLLALAAVHAVWRLAPLAARVLAPAALACATARVTGLYLLYGRSTDALISAVATWVFLAITIALVYRAPLKAGARKGLAWLRVRARPRPAKDGGKQGGKEGVQEGTPPGRAKRDPKLLEAERVAQDALSALDRGEVDSAVEALRCSIGIAPTKRAHTYLGTILGARGDSQEALSELDRALELDPGYSEALDEKVRVLDGLGRADEARGVRESLRTSRGGAPSVPAPAHEITRCPACGREAPPGAESCECGVPFKECARCGRGGVSLRARDGELVCARCRTREAAGHAKGRDLLAEARAFRGQPPWLAAAAFAGAVVLGVVLGFPYEWWRQSRALRSLAVVAAEMSSALERSGEGLGGEAPTDDLARAQHKVLARNEFLKNHPATLKISLAVYGLGRSRELESEEPELGRVARDWARRRLVEAKGVIEAGGAVRLAEGFSRTLRSAKKSLELMIDHRRRLAAELARLSLDGHSGPAASSGQEVAGPAREFMEVKRDWRGVWRKPETGTVFHIERFRRVSARDPRAVVVGSHKDGSALAADGLIRCEVVKPRAEDGFALRMAEAPFEVRELDETPGRFPPDVRLVPRADGPERASEAVPFRVEFGKDLEFRALLDESPIASAPDQSPAAAPGKEPAGVLVTRESLYAAKDIPYPRLPIFAAGMGESWEEDEMRLWPYAGAQPTRGPCVRQLARWTAGGKSAAQRVGGAPAEPDVPARVGLAWYLRYLPLSRKSSQRIVQNWTSGRAWWNVYDDGRLFFRSYFPGAAGGQIDGRAGGRARGQEHGEAERP